MLAKIWSKDKAVLQGIVGEARNYVWPYLLQLLTPEWPTNFIDSQLQSLRKGYDQLLGKCEVSPPSLSLLGAFSTSSTSAADHLVYCVCCWIVRSVLRLAIGRSWIFSTRSSASNTAQGRGVLKVRLVGRPTLTRFALLF
jgi:hypothetical protein